MLGFEVGAVLDLSVVGELLVLEVSIFVGEVLMNLIYRLILKNYNCSIVLMEEAHKNFSDMLAEKVYLALNLLQLLIKSLALLVSLVFA
jgi:hypothetical protein